MDQTEIMYTLLMFTVNSSISTSGGIYWDVMSGSNINISCNLSGILSPNSYSIKWTLNRKITEFNYTNVYVNSLLSTDYVISTLHIVSARHPMDEGVYECIGNDSLRILVAPIKVRILGMSLLHLYWYIGRSGCQIGRVNPPPICVPLSKLYFLITYS